jgi:hypothetical protein
LALIDLHVLWSVVYKEDVMFQRRAVIVLLASLVCVGVSGSVASAEKESDAAAISGIARAADQRPLIDYVVRLRSLDTGRAVATVRTNTTGEYAFRGVSGGRYAVEIVDATDKIVGTAGPFAISATGARSHVIRVALVGGAAAAGFAALSTKTSSKGSAADVATAAASAGITGNGGTSRKMVVPSCC